MDAQTVEKLNNLNNEFYEKTAEYFDNSRQYFWQGWHQLLSSVSEVAESGKPLLITDIGCGNARFAEFLVREMPKQKIKYTGIDSSESLLNYAQKNLSAIPENIESSLLKNDIVTDLATNKSIFPKNFPQQDAITLFGVWHHIPSAELRVRLFIQASSQLKPGGILVIAAWQFCEFERFRKKIISPEKAGIDSGTLEPNDYILDWKRGTTAYRYCHFSNLEELESTVKAISSIKIVDAFKADGKEEKVNQYIVVQNKVQ